MEAHLQNSEHSKRHSAHHYNTIFVIPRIGLLVILHTFAAAAVVVSLHLLQTKDYQQVEIAYKK